ncbi:MAG: peptidylprolyl isomerase [Oculatellaceae cyanobacterium Prado106]|jgi:parvulin-like peptidyl-prolyl isomerase|nr:peptidylprolyl isomerase [Oculatellaceae cyanobacterium Prado106]
MRALKIGDRHLNTEQIVAALVQYKLLEPLVGQVLLDKAIQQVPLSELELVRALSGNAEAEMPKDLSAFVTQWCQKVGIEGDYFEGVILRDMRIEKFKKIQFGQQVEAEFMRLKPEFDQAEYSLIRVADAAFAQEIYFHLRDDGADFESLARLYSIGPERQTGGRIGPIALSHLPPVIAQQFRSESSGVHPPIALSDASTQHFWIVRLERFLPASLTESTRSQIINGLYERWLRSQINHFLSQPDAIQVCA